MKLSTKTSHRAPVMKVRYHGKLHTRAYWNRQNHPGRAHNKPIAKSNDLELVNRPASEGLITSPREVAREMSMFRRIMARLRGER